MDRQDPGLEAAAPAPDGGVAVDSAGAEPVPVEDGAGVDPPAPRRRDRARVRIKQARYLFPNGITSLSLAFALTSIFCSIAGQFEWAGWLIVWCALLDKADGAVARLLRATSDFGLQMDSLVDLVAFGVAPAVLGHTAMRHAGISAATPIIPSGGAIFYVICVAGRLAHFNTTTEDQSDTFRGIPSTLGGAMIGTGLLVWATGGPGGELLLRAAASGYVVLGILMVAPVRLPKVKMRDSAPMNAFTAVCALTTFGLGFSRILPEVLFAESVIYLVVGLFVGTAPHLRERRRARSEAS